MISTLLELAGLIAIAAAVALLTAPAGGLLVAGVEAAVLGFCLDGMTLPRLRFRRHRPQDHEQ